MSEPRPLVGSPYGSADETPTNPGRKPAGFLSDVPLPFEASTIEAAIAERLHEQIAVATDREKLTEVIELQLEHGKQLAELGEYVHEEFGKVFKALGSSSANIGRYADERTYDRMQRTAVEKLLKRITAQLGNGHSHE